MFEEMEEMLQVINLNTWRKKSEILRILHQNGYIKVTERSWRVFVEKYNKYYMDNVNNKYIVHSSKGYKLTSDKKEILASIQDLRNRSLNMLSKYSKTQKALGLQDNLKLDLEKMEII